MAKTQGTSILNSFPREGKQLRAFRGPGAGSKNKYKTASFLLWCAEVVLPALG